MRIILLGLLLISNSGWSQTILTINKSDGTTQSYNIEDIRKITFGPAELDENGNSGNAERLLNAEKAMEAIKTFAVLKSYPNPFNPSTSIDFHIPAHGEVEVGIYDVQGKLIKVMESGPREVGSYSLSWDSTDRYGNSVPSGIYIFQVRYQNSILTKKVVKIK